MVVLVVMVSPGHLLGTRFRHPVGWPASREPAAATPTDGAGRRGTETGRAMGRACPGGAGTRNRAASPTPVVRPEPCGSPGARSRLPVMGRLSRFRRSRADRQAGLLVLAGLAIFVGGVYVVVVLGGGMLIGRTSSPSLALSVLATAIVALAFEPAQSRLERLAADLVRGGKPSPYDVLSRF